MWQYIWSTAHQGSSSETHCPEFLLGLHYVYMTDWLITHLVELSLQANWYHVTQAFPPYSHGWVLVWPASALNCDLPSRVDIGYLPEIEGKGQPSVWTRSDSLLDTLDRSIMTNLWEWGLKELQPYSALWWLPCCCFLLWLWAVKFQDYPLEQRWGLGRGQVKILQSSLFLLKFSAIYFSVDTPWIAASLWLISRVVKESILIILPFFLAFMEEKNFGGPYSIIHQCHSLSLLFWIKVYWNTAILICSHII